MDYDLIRQIVAEMIEEANNGGGGTDPEPEEPEVPVDPSGMTTVRWTPNGVVSPIPASVSGWNAGAIAGDLAPTANGTTLILDRDSFIDFGTVAFNLPETASYLTTQIPSVLRMAFKGVLSAEAGRVFDFTHWANCDFKFSVPWMADRLVLGYHRGAEGQPEVGEDLNCIADFKLGENHLYEIIWTNDAAGAGGEARFYIDGVQTGPTVASAYKLRASNNMLMNCNASMGNTSDGRRLEVEYLEIGFKA
ncbi:hypothetical protein [Novosphingobium sp. TCA1]|uniref:hypothetical protein n=1 Tax=Novosphingobium sp. TCA1 TaxID=2682474 RepID=UPI001F3D415A|nr:hypothetical protein [Novosphingobium sp. TCA1]